MSDRLTAMDLAQLRGPQQWKEEDARRVLAALREGGATVTAFAREHGLGRKRILWWRHRLASWRSRETKPRKQETARLIPAVPIALSGSAATSVSIRLAGGVVVEVVETSSVEPEWVSRLVSGLAERA